MPRPAGDVRRELVRSLDPGSEGQVNWWAGAFARQCRDALDELTFLAPWTLSRASLDKLNEFPVIGEIPTLRQLAKFEVDLLPAIEDRLGLEVIPGESVWLDKLRRLITKASRLAGTRIAAIERLALQSGELARMEYDFLFDKARHLLAIGYNVAARRLDPSYYDLLASEARFSSFVGIAQGELPQESWFALGRLLTTVGGESLLISWSGSMFEYLMPLLVMPTYENTLLDQTCKMAVERQIEYGKTRGVPWGISESGYNAIDIHLNYQYRAFGVPGLGFQRGLSEDLVIAPYASALALMVAPEKACLNLEQLTAAGFEGKFGFYEAIDYTPSRLLRGQSSAVVRSFMSHHQGMIFSLWPICSWTGRCRSDSSRTLCSRRPCCYSRSASPKSRRSMCPPMRSPDHNRLPALRRHRCESSTTPIRRYQKCSCCQTADIM